MTVGIPIEIWSHVVDGWLESQQEKTLEHDKSEAGLSVSVEEMLDSLTKKKSEVPETIDKAVHDDDTKEHKEEIDSHKTHDGS